MSTSTTTTTTDRADRRRTVRADRKRRAAEAAAVVVIRRMSAAELRRSALASRRMTAADVTADVITRRPDLLTSLIADPADVGAGRAVRMTARSVVTNAAERMTFDPLRTMADQVGRTAALRADLIGAALDADGQVAQADADPGRRFAMSAAADRAGMAAALAAPNHGPLRTDRMADQSDRRADLIDTARADGRKAERKRMPYIRERHDVRGAATDSSIKSAVRLIRETSLETLLSDGFRPDADRSIDHDATTDRLWSAAWWASAADALRADRIGGRKGSARAALGAAVAAAESGRAGMTAGTFRSHVRAAAAVLRAAERDVVRMDSDDPGLTTADGSPRHATAAEKRAARTAAASARESWEAWRDAAVIRTVANRHPDRFLSEALRAAVTVNRSAVDWSAESSGIDWRALALAIGADASDTGLKALREFVRDAVGGMVVRDGLRDAATARAVGRAGMVGRAVATTGRPDRTARPNGLTVRSAVADAIRPWLIDGSADLTIRHNFRP